MKKVIGLSFLVSSVVFGSGYKLSTASINSSALGAAYVAHTFGADTAYFNPAAMVFMDDKSYIEGGMTLAHLPSIRYTSDANAAYNGKSKVENIPIPWGHFVSKPHDDWRWGISLVAPGGLSKRWDTQAQKASAEEFTLRVVELNPSIAYKMSDYFSVGAGLRLIYTDGVVKSTAAVSRDMEGDGTTAGYNLAALFKPTNDVNIAVTYRSKVNLKEEGNAKLYYGATKLYDGGASVQVPLPATLMIGVSKTWNDKLTIEADYERAYWSAYRNLDFEYDSPIAAPLVPYFDAPVAKNWEDANTYRLGVTYKLDDATTLMAGYARGKSPTPNKTIGFELPESDANYYSFGGRYKISPDMSIGGSLLYGDKDKLRVPAGEADNSVIKQGGTFDKGGALLATVGLAYEF